MTEPALITAQALEMLRTIEAVNKKHEQVNEALAALYQDMRWLSPIPTEVEIQIVALLDAILGDALASYYLYECNRSPGRIIEGGKEWPIASVDDLVTYLADRDSKND